MLPRLPRVGLHRRHGVAAGPAHRRGLRWPILSVPPNRGPELARASIMAAGAVRPAGLRRQAIGREALRGASRALRPGHIYPPLNVLRVRCRFSADQSAAQGFAPSQPPATGQPGDYESEEILRESPGEMVKRNGGATEGGRVGGLRGPASLGAASAGMTPRQDGQGVCEPGLRRAPRRPNRSSARAVVRPEESASPCFRT